MSILLYLAVWVSMGGILLLSLYGFPIYSLAGLRISGFTGLLGCNNRGLWGALASSSIRFRRAWDGTWRNCFGSGLSSSLAFLQLTTFSFGHLLLGLGSAIRGHIGLYACTSAGAGAMVVICGGM